MSNTEVCTNTTDTGFKVAFVSDKKIIIDDLDGKTATPEHAPAVVASLAEQLGGIGQRDVLCLSSGGGCSAFKIEADTFTGLSEPSLNDHHFALGVLIQNGDRHLDEGDDQGLLEVDAEHIDSDMTEADFLLATASNSTVILVDQNGLTTEIKHAVGVVDWLSKHLGGIGQRRVYCRSLRGEFYAIEIEDDSFAGFNLCSDETQQYLQTLLFDCDTEILSVHGTKVYTPVELAQRKENDEMWAAIQSYRIAWALVEKDGQLSFRVPPFETDDPNREPVRVETRLEQIVSAHCEQGRVFYRDEHGMYREVIQTGDADRPLRYPLCDTEESERLKSFVQDNLL